MGVNVNMEKYIKSLWIVVAAFFIGQVKILEVNPMAVGLITAVCLCGESYGLVYISLMAGVALSFPVAHIIRYGVVMLGIIFLLNSRGIVTEKGNSMAMAVLAGMVDIAVNLSVYYFLPGTIMIEAVFLEGILVFSAAMIYQNGIKTIKSDYVRIASESQASISVMLFAVSVLYGMPDKIFGGIVLAETFAVFSILFSIYKFGFAVGMSWTVIAGGIMASRYGDVNYITGWVVVTMGAYALVNMLRGGRLAFMIVYTGVYYLLGIVFFDSLLEETSQKAILSAAFVFLLAPARVMLRVDDRVRNNELAENSPEWGRLVINRVNALASAFKRIEYTLASDVNAGIGFNDVGILIENFTNQLDRQVPLRKTIEARILEELSLLDIEVKNFILVKNNEDRFEVYITSRVRKGRIVSAQIVKKIVEREMGVNLELKDESRRIVSRNYEVICLHERPAFSCITAVRRISKYQEEVSGDNFYIGDILDGQKLIIIADGMGNGRKAAGDSNILIESMEELLSAGFDKEMSIRIVNSYLADKNKGETFSTLDMLLLDLHTGYGKIYKQGAATTFVKRGEWMEMIKSTSLPVGVIEGAVCEKCSKKFYKDDIIVMMSDGVLESIPFENNEDYMRNLIMNTDLSTPEEIVTEISEQIMAVSGNRLKDDATIIACKLVKTL